MTLPLSGLRIVAVEQYGAGPYGTQHLADLGAEVVKVENARTGGDMSRGVGPYFLGDGDSEFYQSINRNKKSLALDLKHPDGKAAFHKLVATADGLMGNLRADQPEKLGLTYADLKHVNPKIVCAHLSAYGRDNDRAGCQTSRGLRLPPQFARACVDRGDEPVRRRVEDHVVVDRDRLGPGGAR